MTKKDVQAYIKKLEEVLRWYVENGEDEGDTVDYMIDMLKNSLKEAVD